MPSSIIDSSYFCDMFGTNEMRLVFSDHNRIQKWLDTEVALAVAQEKVGIINSGLADQIKKAARIEHIDIQEMKHEFDRVGFPILPFIHQLAKACDPETAKWIHYGATTQDILDTGMVLQIKEGLQLIEADLADTRKYLINLAKKYRNTVMPGRTFMQQAAPVTFGYKVAIWLDEILRHQERLLELKNRLLVGQCAGAVGTFATLDSKGLLVQNIMMDYLGLGVPDITWHVSRDRWAELLSWFALVTATMGKIANEIAILMRTEIAEVSEPFEKGRGASTTLPQKRNPIECEPIIAIAHKMRELSGSQYIAMIQEHERGVGHMHLEWMTIPEAFVLISAGIFHTNNILKDLHVNEKRMYDNLKMGGGLLMAEAVMMGIAPKFGKKKAHELVYSAAGFVHEKGVTFREALKMTPEIKSELSETDLDSLLEPANYTGIAGNMVDTVLTRAGK